MKRINTYFRAVNDYRKNTDKQPECVKIRAQIAEACREKDKIQTERVRCTIKTDWVEEIEKGLVFVEKALKEERQFIRSNGEVVPIEKVRHVSKSSVEHLARHSELITRETEGEDLTPDKIYTVEKLTDFSVYENRFLYMMLCYLRDFISIRYSKILDAVNTYKGKAQIEKTIHTPSGELNFSMKLSEVNRGDEYLAAHNEAKDILDRIDLLLKTVMLFLSFPLMQEVKKSPMLKPPITKTNVLRMNHNFKGSLALYEYVSAYDEDGYTLTTETKEINGFRNGAAEDFAELTRAASFLTYEYGLDIREHLTEMFEREEQERKAEEQRKLVAQMEALRKRVKESGLGMEEYMLMLEKRNKALQADSEELEIVRKDNERLSQTISLQENTISSLNSEIERLNEQYESTVAAHAAEITAMNERFAEEKQAMAEEHSREIEALNSAHESEKEMLTASFEEEKNNIISAYNAEIERINGEIDSRIGEVTAKYEAQISTMHESYGKEIEGVRSAYYELNHKLEDASKDNAAMRQKNAELSEGILLLKAKLNALKSKYSAFDGTEKFDTEDGFNDLEEQYKVFKKFFDSTWKKTKRTIRKKALSDLKEGKFDKKAGDGDSSDDI